MRDSTIAKNYAETLLELARRAEDLDGWGRMIMEVADALEADESLRLFLATPRVSADAKNEILARAFQDRMPRHFVRFLQTLVKNRRHALIQEIADQYRSLLDDAEGRVHAHVTVARESTEEDEALIASELSRVLGKTVIPHLTVNPEILGGVVVRVGDDIMDGSVRRRLAALRNQLVYGQR